MCNDSKREYTSPRLTVFGKIEDLTKSDCFGGKVLSNTSDDSFTSQFTFHNFGQHADDCSVS